MDSYRAHIERRFTDDADLWQAFDGLCAAVVAAAERLDTPLDEGPAQMSARDAGVTLQRATVSELREEFSAKHIEPHAVGRFFRAAGSNGSISVWLFMEEGFRAIQTSMHSESDVWLDSLKGSAERFLAQYSQRAVTNAVEIDEAEIGRSSGGEGRWRRGRAIFVWVGDHIAQVLVGVIVAVVLAWLGLKS